MPAPPTSFGFEVSASVSVGAASAGSASTTPPCRPFRALNLPDPRLETRLGPRTDLCSRRKPRRRKFVERPLRSWGFRTIFSRSEGSWRTRAATAGRNSDVQPEHEPEWADDAGHHRIQLGAQTFCIETTSVREIRGWGASTPLPHTSAEVLGVCYRSPLHPHPNSKGATYFSLRLLISPRVPSISAARKP